MKNIDFGKQLIEVRKSKGLTQQEVAEKCNITIRTIQRIESGTVTPRFSTIKIIAGALNIDLFEKSNSRLDSSTLVWYLKDLFNLKTNIVRKLSILSGLILIFVFVSSSLINIIAQHQTDHITNDNENTAKRKKLITSPKIPIDKYHIEVKKFKIRD